MKSVGQLLKETRESQNLSVKQVSSATKIRESLIEALEKGEYLIFSSDMHLKSFLRSYAHYLGINEDRVMALYRRERQIEFPDEDKSPKKNTKDKSFYTFASTFIISRIVNFKTILSSIALIILALAGFFFYSQWRAFNQPPTLEILSPGANEVISTDTFVIEGFTGNPSVKVVLDGNEATYVDSNGKFKINAKFTEPGLKRFNIIAQSEFNKQREVTLDLTYQPPVKPPTRHKIRIANKTKNIVTVLVKKDKQTVATPKPINQTSTEEMEFDETIEVRNFDKSLLDLYLDEDTSPTTSIDSKSFSIKIENNRPIIQSIKELMTTPSPSPSPTATKKNT